MRMPGDYQIYSNFETGRVRGFLRENLSLPRDSGRQGRGRGSFDGVRFFVSDKEDLPSVAAVDPENVTAFRQQRGLLSAEQKAPPLAGAGAEGEIVQEPFSERFRYRR